jgi:hypothetical protein
MALDQELAQFDSPNTPLSDRIRLRMTQAYIDQSRSTEKTALAMQGLLELEEKPAVILDSDLLLKQILISELASQYMKPNAATTDAGMELNAKQDAKYLEYALKEAFVVAKRFYNTLTPETTPL